MGKKSKDQRRKKRKGKSKTKAVAGIYRLMNSDLSLYGCWLNQDWKTINIAYMLIARKMPSGLLIVSSFTIETSAPRCEDCFGLAHITEENFRKDFIDLEKVNFYKVEIELVKEVLATVLVDRRDFETPVPKDFDDCLRLVGSIDLEAPPPEDPEDDDYAVCFRYQPRDLDEAEIELRQVSAFEELDNRQFLWAEAEKKSLFSKGPKKELARLKFVDGILHMNVLDEYKADDLNTKLLGYLGATVVQIEE